MLEDHSYDEALHELERGLAESAHWSAGPPRKDWDPAVAVELMKESGIGDEIPSFASSPAVAGGHRDKIGPRSFPFNAMVARSVNKQELSKSPAAQAAMKKEWDRLRAKKVWDESVVRERDDVAREAREKS